MDLATGSEGGQGETSRSPEPLLTIRADPVEVDLIAREAVLPLAADGLDRPPFASTSTRASPAAGTVNVAVVSPSLMATENRYVPPACRSTTKSTGTPSIDEAGLAPLTSSGPFRTGASSRTCRLMSATPRAIASSASSPASMNLGLNWWAK